MNEYPDELGGRWRGGVVLKRDVFSTIERGHYRTDAGEVEAVLRRIDQVPWWTFGSRARLVSARARRAGGCRHARDCAAAAVCRPPRAGARLDRRRGAAHRQAGRRRRRISVRRNRRCARCTAPASPTTISPRSRTGSTPTGAPISPTSSSRPASAAAARCSASRATRICVTCSSTSAAMRPTR